MSRTRIGCWSLGWSAVRCIVPRSQPSRRAANASRSRRQAAGRSARGRPPGPGGGGGRRRLRARGGGGGGAGRGGAGGPPLLGLAVGEVGGAQHGGAGEEVVEPPGVQLVEVEQVADLLLDRPRVAVAPGE